ncbi:DUF1853 family protein [Parachitinimonas caeni]|uniref:DUF1853 family protein n=1 Tax=Parachitinimonas caeni TaxID=3031301 RepID=A0ABT7DV45_9NEIS|nr:DUF1853 family protein [Parachitinimonas caeni]MDK2122963.1 DUF1853 family protein [Parachitinimonas caeni]
MIASDPDWLPDLRWLLTSPSLLADASLPEFVCHGSPRLGTQWLQQLDQTALKAELDATALQAEPFRLGRYAERLMQATLQHLPDHRLLAHQLAVHENGISKGEYDFLVSEPAGEIWHLELAVKIYVALPLDGTLHYLGPGLRDALRIKLARLFDHQLRLAFSTAGRAALPVQTSVRPLAWLRGWMFYRDPNHLPWSGLAAAHLRGWWRRWGEDLPRQRQDSRWRYLPRQNWMAPRSARPEDPEFSRWIDTLHTSDTQHSRPVMVAEYAPPEEGGAELARGLLLPRDWPDSKALNALLARLQTINSA